MAELPSIASDMAPQESKGPSADHIRSVFGAYAERQRAGDVEGILAASGGANDMKLEGAVRIAGNQAAAAFIVRTLRSRPVYRVETLDVMTFDDAGLITEMVAYWGPDNFTRED